MQRMILAMLVAGTVATGWAQPGEGGPGRRGHGSVHGPGGMGTDFLHPDMMMDLGLSEEQKKKFKEQRLANQKKKIQIRSEKAILELDLQNVFSTLPVKEAEAVKIAEKIADLDRKALILRVESMSRFLSSLTPEQHRKMMEHQAVMREKRNTWREEMGKGWKHGDIRQNREDGRGGD